jgi:phosphoribosylaminoimidazole-succinocarboxamide synthase
MTVRCWTFSKFPAHEDPVPLASPVLETTLAGRRPDRTGKVRDIYDYGDRLLIVATDRISAFDYVLEPGIRDKGAILTQISAFWFTLTRDIVANHVLSTDVLDFPPDARAASDIVAGRSMLVTKTEPLAIECVARGFLAGSAWTEYQSSGTVCGIRLPAGLVESQPLPEPIFTPATKASTGHDLNITGDEAADIVGRDLFERVRDLTLALYKRGAAHAEARGIIVADTKFEFGVLPTPPGSPAVDRLIVIDEMLTPDSSRFWPKDAYRPGGPQPSFDKQFVRDYLIGIKWNRQPPVPVLPDAIVSRTREKYLEALRRLTDRDLA